MQHNLFLRRDAREIAQWSRALVALAVNAGLVPKTHMVIYNHLQPIIVF